MSSSSSPAGAAADRTALESPGNPVLERLTLICGCMFSGKTTEMLRRVRSLPVGGAVVFKHSKDRRYSPTHVVAHGSDRAPAVPVSSAAAIPLLISEEHRLIAIDEGHFFGSDLPEVAAALASSGRDVVVTALDLNSWGRPFRVVEELRTRAGQCLVLTTECRPCGGIATRTQRKTPIVDGQIIGGPEAFEPRCPKCWTAPPEPNVDA